MEYIDHETMYSFGQLYKFDIEHNDARALNL